MATINSKPLPPLNERDIQRFWRLVQRGDLAACWPWRGTTAVIGGYGRFSVKHGGKQRSLLAHRVAFGITRGLDLTGAAVCHSCDNPPCCNPRHLSRSNQAQNAHERQLRGRGSKLKGITHPCARLNAAQVREIRCQSRAGLESYRQLGKRFGLAKNTIGDIVTGRSWKSVA